MDNDEILMEDVGGEAEITTPDIPVFPGDEIPDAEVSPDNKVEEAPERRRKRHHREDASDTLGMLWGGAGMALERADYKGLSVGSYPTGRAMQIQSLVAGKYLDTVIRDTWIDRILVQPLVRVSNTAEGLGAVLALPMMVYAIDKKPQLAPALEQWLSAAFYQTIEDMEPIIKKQQADQEKKVRAARSMGEAFGEEGTDPFQAFMNALFTPPGEPEHAAPTDPQPTPEPSTVSRPVRTTRSRQTKGGVS